MHEDLVNRFTAALERLEAARDIEPLISVFAEQCRLGNALVPDRFHGRDGARQFWRDYRSTFRDLRSTIRSRIIGQGQAALEWASEGTALNGAPVRYEGVTIIEGGEEGITRLHAYFDTRQLGRQFEPAMAARRPSTRAAG